MRMEKNKFLKVAASIGVSSFLLTGCGDYEEENVQQENTAVKTDGGKQGSEQEPLNCDDRAPTTENVEKMSYARKIIHHFHRIKKTLTYRYYRS